MTLIPDLDTVRRSSAIVAETVATRVGIIGARPGNPLRAEVRRFGGALATRLPMFGEHFFNRAHGFDDGSLEAAATVADWYAEGGVAGAFEIEPGPATDRLMAMLHERGYRQVGFHATLAAYPDLPQSPSPGVEVRRVESDADLAAFSDAYHLGWSNTGPRVPMQPWLTAPGWSLFLGLCDGQAAGAALLSQYSGDAYLADASVDPKWRGRGVHRALLDRRCVEANAAGAKLVFSGANYLSTSYCNMLRKGLSLLYTEAIWRAPQPKASG